MTTRGNQQGMALIAVLLILTIVTLLAAAGMQAATQQQTMAGGVRNHVLAFDAAQSALSAGEASLNGAAIPTSSGYYLNPAALPSSSFTGTQEAGWLAFFQNTNNGVAVYSGKLSGVAQPPEYVVEKLESTGSGNAGYYRITAIGYGATGDTQVIVQEVYDVVPSQSQSGSQSTGQSGQNGNNQGQSGSQGGGDGGDGGNNRGNDS